MDPLKIVDAKRVVIKAGTSVVSNEDGTLSLVRVAAIVEQVYALLKLQKEVILISSGAVGCGRRKLRKQSLLGTSLRKQMHSCSSLDDLADEDESEFYSAASASSGQLELMKVYETMFSQFDVAASQFLVTEYDFNNSSRRSHLKNSMEEIIKHCMVPIINENDAVSANQGYTDDNIFSDNDALAALVAQQMGADALVLLTDVDGLYDRAPSEPDASVIPVVYRSVENEFSFGAKSNQGRGGMSAKVGSAFNALQQGIGVVVVASGKDTSVLRKLFVTGEPVGTLFLEQPPSMDGPDGVSSLTPTSAQQAASARDAGRKLQGLSFSERSGVLKAVAQAIRDNEESILLANGRDMSAAKQNNLAPALLQRLKLSHEKLVTVARGIDQLADLAADPLGKVLGRTEVAEGLQLTQLSVPIGVLLIVFESRPDSLPQIASLALLSGNGLLLKGGKEAEHSNYTLHKVVVDAVAAASDGKVPREIVGLVTSRTQVSDLLKLDRLIDLVIPRGSKALVTNIKKNTRIPVLGHADGICHTYIDQHADDDKAAAIAVDGKINYPAACNATETILIHQAKVDSGGCATVMRELRKAGVSLKGGPNAIAQGLIDMSCAAKSLSVEYGDLTCLVEVVANMEEAIAHIHEHGSSHTECIVTEDTATAEDFIQKTDAACIFHNASTRFADGFRFGLGAEVGISTGRIHARGPVGVEGLLTTKWVLRSTVGDTVAGFSGTGDDTRTYTHRSLAV